MSASVSASNWQQRLSGWLHRHQADAADDVRLPKSVGHVDFSRPTPPAASLMGVDKTLVWVIVSLLTFGLVMVYSASIAMPDNPRFANYSHMHFLLRHSVQLFIGLVFATIAFQVSMQTWERWAPWLFVLSLLLLVAVLIPGVGKVVNGARRWLSLGPLGFQPSELAKFAVLLYAANYMVRKMDVVERFFRVVWPMAVSLVVLGALLLAEPDMGAFLVIAVITMGILFLGGVSALWFLTIFTCLVMVFGLIIAASPWRRERIFAYLDPWDPAYTLGKGYQLSHSLIAIGRGEWFGVGLGGSVEKLHWLPEAHTDFLLAVIGEEFGFIGIAVLLCAFGWLCWRIMRIGREAIKMDRLFAGLVAQGVAVWIGFQALINMGVNLGALPTKGLTLPLLSYGGSAIMVNLIALAVVLRIDLETKQSRRRDLGGRA